MRLDVVAGRRRVGGDRALAPRSRCRRAAASARKPRTRSSCAARISGPQSRSANAGPDLERARSARRAARALPRSATARPAGGCRPSRSGPAFCTIALTSTGSAASRSASAKTICGPLPPSSSVTGQWRFAASCATHAPVAGEPVNEMCSMPGCAASAAPASRAEPGDDVERAVGQPDLGGELRDAQQRQAGVLGRLHHARVAGRERAADRAAEDLQRVVPRNDVARDAVRLAPGEHGVARGIGNRLAVQLVAGAAVELEVARARRDVGARLLQRLAAVARLDAARARRRGRGSRAPSRASRRPFSAGASRPHAPSRARLRRASRRGRCRRALPRAIAANGWPSDGSIIGSVSPPAGATQRLPMKCCGGVVIGGQRMRSVHDGVSRLGRVTSAFGLNFHASVFSSVRGT